MPKKYVTHFSDEPFLIDKLFSLYKNYGKNAPVRILWLFLCVFFYLVIYHVLTTQYDQTLMNEHTQQYCWIAEHVNAILMLKKADSGHVLVYKLLFFVCEAVANLRNVFGKGAPSCAVIERKSEHFS